MSFWGGRKQQDSTSSDSTSASKPTHTPAGTSRRPEGFETVLGASATLQGDLKSQGNVRLDGTFEGTLEIDGNVLVGEPAKITADINAKNVSIAGAVRGDVSGKKVQILRTGRVWGNITATAISTEEGCFIEGKITMVTHDAAQTFEQRDFPLPDLPGGDSTTAATPDAPATTDAVPSQPDDTTSTPDKTAETDEARQ